MLFRSSLSMREGETLKTYSDRYWEMFNEIDGDFDDVAIRTLCLTKKPERNMRRFINRIDEYKWVKEDQQ